MKYALWVLQILLALLFVLTGVVKLVIIMIGATTITIAGGMILMALFPFVVGILCAYIACG